MLASLVTAVLLALLHRYCYSLDSSLTLARARSYCVLQHRHRNITYIGADGSDFQLAYLDRRYVDGLVGQLPWYDTCVCVCVYSSMDSDDLRVLGWCSRRLYF
jgi:hypothetical protein